MHDTPLKSAGNPKDTEKIQRKRVQNRISQRCAREKKLTQSRNVSNFMDLVKKTKPGSQENHNVLVNAYMELMEENDRLNEALLRMRKKLLSISNSSATAANDHIFESLLKRGGDNCSQPKQVTQQTFPPTASLEVVSADDIPALEAPSPSNSQTSSHNSRPVHSPTMPSIIHLHGSIEADSLFDNEYPSEELLHDSPQEQGAGHIQQEEETCSSMSEPVHGHFNYSLVAQYTAPAPIQAFSTDPLLAWSSLTNLNPGIPAFTATDSIFDSHGKLSSTRMTDAVERACVIYMCEEFGIPYDQFEHHGPSSLACLKAQYSKYASSDIVNNLAKVAVRLLLTHSGLGDYVNGVGCLAVMESIMQWRLAPTEERLSAIPEPFRPTPLQQRSTYSAAIDMLNWPLIRDHLILLTERTQQANIDQIIRDVALHTVFDVPQLRLSLSTFDVYYNTIDRDRSSPLISHQELERKLEGSSALRPHMNCSYIGQLWLEVAREMSMMQDSASLDTVGSEVLLRGTSGNSLARKLGVSRFSEWRLSRDWQDSHPYLSVEAGATACFPTVPAVGLLVT